MFFPRPLLKLLTLFLLTLGSLIANECTEVYGQGTTKLSLATGSPGELGLLRVIAERFAHDNDAQICWIKAGSGKTLSLLKEKKIDIAMVHAPRAEKKAIAQGWAEGRILLGSNEFYIVGPANDPAKIKTSQSAPEAYARIAAKEALFYSRGDNSGTHQKELAIWKLTGVTPEGKWYEINKDFMLATLKKADKTGAYFMTDSSTWVVAKKELKNLKILFRGDKMLINTYVALKQPGSENIKKQKSQKFIDFLASPQGQKLIEAYGVNEYGESLYNGAAYAKKYFD